MDDASEEAIGAPAHRPRREEGEGTPWTSWRDGALPRSLGRRGLVGLFAMVASLAEAALDGVAGADSKEVPADPPQAAELIDVLIVLRDKTEGHRTPQETKILADLIYDLQFRYAKATRR